MGNRFVCMTRKDAKESGNVSRSKRMAAGRSQRKLVMEEELLHRQALSMALNQSQRFDGSMSRRINGNTSSRRRALPDHSPNGKPI